MVELFEVWGTDFTASFVSSYGQKYILVTIDYVAMWVETIVFPNNEGKSVTTFTKKNIFVRFGTSQAILSDRGSQLWNWMLSALLAKYGFKHKVANTYPQ